MSDSGKIVWLYVSLIGILCVTCAFLAFRNNGEIGPIGPRGIDEEGPQGIMGPTGPIGLLGPSGPIGPIGMVGYPFYAYIIGQPSTLAEGQFCIINTTLYIRPIFQSTAFFVFLQNARLVTTEVYVSISNSGFLNIDGVSGVYPLVSAALYQITSITGPSTDLFADPVINYYSLSFTLISAQTPPGTSNQLQNYQFLHYANFTP